MDVKSLILKYFPIISYRFLILKQIKKASHQLRNLPGNSKSFGPPRGIYLSSNDYNSANVKKIKEARIYQGFLTKRILPVTNSEFVNKKLKNYISAKTLGKKNWTIPQGRYLYNGNKGGVIITKDDKVFFPCSPLKNENNPMLHQALYFINLPKVKKLNKVVLIDTRSADDNYCHWLRDHVARFHWLEKMGIDYSQYSIITTMGKSSFYTFSIEILKQYGFNFKEWLDTSSCKHIEAEELIVPSYCTRALNCDGTSFDQQEAIFLQKLFLVNEEKASNAKRLYISRRRSTRSSPNEIELVKSLDKFGFEEVFLEDYDISGQAAMFHHAEIIIGLHGAAFTNLHFCKKGTKVVEIFSPDFIVSDYWVLANQMELQYHAYCDDIFFKNIQIYRLARQEPTHLDVDKFLDFLNTHKII